MIISQLSHVGVTLVTSETCFGCPHRLALRGLSNPQRLDKPLRVGGWECVFELTTFPV